MAEVTEWDSGKLKRLTLGPALGELDAPDGAMRLRVLLLDGDSTPIATDAALGEATESGRGTLYG